MNTCRRRAPLLPKVSSGRLATDLPEEQNPSQTNAVDFLDSRRHGGSPVDVCDVGVSDCDAVPVAPQPPGEPQRIQIVLVDDVPDGILPQQVLPLKFGCRFNGRTEGNVTGRFTVAISHGARVFLHGSS